MFGKVFGGPLVQLVEHQNGQLVIRSKRKLAVGAEATLKVAGQLGKPAKIKADIVACRALDAGGFVCTGVVKDIAHQRELTRLGSYAVAAEQGVRQDQRIPRRMDLNYSDVKTTSVDISSGGIQIESSKELQEDEISRLVLTPELSCEARVAWVKDNRAGLEFWKVDDATKILLSRFASGRASTVHKTPDLQPAEVKPKPRLSLMDTPDYDSLD